MGAGRKHMQSAIQYQPVLIIVRKTHMRFYIQSRYSIIAVAWQWDTSRRAIRTIGSWQIQGGARRSSASWALGF